MDELLMERYALAKERVCEIKEEKAVQMPYLDFFQKTAAFLEKNVEIMDGVVFLGEAREPRKLADAADLSIDEWKELNRDLYADILPENYRNSLGNTEKTFLSCMQSCVVLWSMPLKRGCGT